MLRLHATGAIAMPVEVRLQILASSRDVIHSWSVPSAGVKIDCVPGYTSHKIMIFLMEGIYWGQCMEICGRYHHWMPIMVYFMRRDLFFLWCTHFIFTTNMTKEWEINDRPYINYIKSVTQSSSNWINEVSK
jgi:heme/copper-type cytochrome/quinol oxidase subunit 2